MYICPICHHPKMTKAEKQVYDALPGEVSGLALELGLNRDTVTNVLYEMERKGVAKGDNAWPRRWSRVVIKASKAIEEKYR